MDAYMLEFFFFASHTNRNDDTTFFSYILYRYIYRLSIGDSISALFFERESHVNAISLTKSSARGRDFAQKTTSPEKEDL